MKQNYRNTSFILMVLLEFCSITTLYAQEKSILYQLVKHNLENNTQTILLRNSFAFTSIGSKAEFASYDPGKLAVFCSGYNIEWDSDRFTSEKYSINTHFFSLSNSNGSGEKWKTYPQWIVFSNNIEPGEYKGSKTFNITVDGRNGTLTIPYRIIVLNTKEVPYAMYFDEYVNVHSDNILQPMYTTEETEYKRYSIDLKKSYAQIAVTKAKKAEKRKEILILPSLALATYGAVVGILGPIVFNENNNFFTASKYAAGVGGLTLIIGLTTKTKASDYNNIDAYYREIGEKYSNWKDLNASINKKDEIFNSSKKESELVLQNEILQKYKILFPETFKAIK